MIHLFNVRERFNPGKVVFFSLLMMAIIVPQVSGGGFAVKRKVSGYDIEILMKRDPSVSSRNDLHIAIKDPNGKFVANAPVMVNYYMPPMPNMAPMNYKVKAEPRGNAYQVSMNLIMAGPWIIVVNTNVDGKNFRVSVPIDIR